MRLFILALGLIGLLSFSANAQDKAVEKRHLKTKSKRLRRIDVATAFAIASPSIQRMFGTPENFGNMVRGTYPMVWRPAEVTFLDQRQEGIVIWQRVRIVDQQNANIGLPIKW